MSDKSNQVAHTSGPWHVQDNTEQGPNDQLRVDSLYDGAIAICGTGDVVNGEMRANARLIAAAPDGLALIEKILAADASQFSSAAQFQSWCALIAKPYLASVTGETS